MAAKVIPLLSRIRPAQIRDWSQREVAEFYRVESALVQAGLQLETERGLTDEGDPWFCFCRADTGEVFIHFARVDGRYVVDGGPLGAAARGDDFAELVRELISRHPLSAARRSGSNVFLHPAALLIALVGACFFHSGQAKAAETAEGHAARVAEAARRHALTLVAGGAPPAGSDAPAAFAVALDAAQTAAILTGVLIGLRDATPAAAGPRVGVAAISTGVGADAPLRLAGPERLHVAEAGSPAESRAVLAVVAVLHDLFRLQAAAPRLVDAPVAAPSEGVVAVAAATPPPGDAPPSVAPLPVSSLAAPALDRPVLVVHLSAAALPHVEAVALLEVTGVLKVVGDEHIDALDKLPAYLADAIAHGEHVQVGAPAVPAGASLDDATLAGGLTDAVTPDHPAGGDHAPSTHVDATLPPAEGGTAAAPPDSPPSADSTPAAPDPAPPAPAPQQVAPAPNLPPPSASLPAPEAPAPAAPDPTVLHHGHSDVFDAAVLKFTAAVHAGIVVSGSEIVLYDPHILEPLAPGEVLDSITFHFDDGSSISVVGTTASLHDLHGVS